MRRIQATFLLLALSACAGTPPGGDYALGAESGGTDGYSAAMAACAGQPVPPPRPFARRGDAASFAQGYRDWYERLRDATLARCADGQGPSSIREALRKTGLAAEWESIAWRSYAADQARAEWDGRAAEREARSYARAVQEGRVPPVVVIEQPSATPGSAFLADAERRRLERRVRELERAQGR